MYVRVSFVTCCVMAYEALCVFFCLVSACLWFNVSVCLACDMLCDVVWFVVFCVSVCVCVLCSA